MKLSKLFAFIFLFLLILNLFFISFINAQLNAGVENLNEKVQNIEDIKEKGESKWEYLGKEWRNIFLKNKIVVAIDSFLKKLSFVFVFLFGEPYSLSLTLFFVIVLWLYFILKFKEIISITAFSNFTCLLISFGLVVLLAQTSLLRKLVEFLGNLIFSQESWWLRAIIFVAILVGFYVLSNLNSLWIKKVKQSKEKAEKEKEKSDRKSFGALVKGLFKGFGKD